MFKSEVILILNNLPELEIKHQLIFGFASIQIIDL